MRSPGWRASPRKQSKARPASASRQTARLFMDVRDRIRYDVWSDLPFTRLDLQSAPMTRPPCTTRGTAPIRRSVTEAAC